MPSVMASTETCGAGGAGVCAYAPRPRQATRASFSVIGFLPFWHAQSFTFGVKVGVPLTDLLSATPLSFGGGFSPNCFTRHSSYTNPYLVGPHNGVAPAVQIKNPNGAIS